MTAIRKRRAADARRGIALSSEEMRAQPSNYVLAYARVSGKESAKGEISIPDQIDRISRWADSRGLTIKEIYTEKGRTATTDKRPSFKKMIHDVESSKYCPKFIVSYDNSRLFRNRVDSELYSNRMLSFGVRSQL